MFLVTQLCLLEPIIGKLRATIRHVFSAEHAEDEKLLGADLRLKTHMEILPLGLSKEIHVPRLHQIVYPYLYRPHTIIFMDKRAAVKVQ